MRSEWNIWRALKVRSLPVAPTGLCLPNQISGKAFHALLLLYVPLALYHRSDAFGPSLPDADRSEDLNHGKMVHYRSKSGDLNHREALGNGIHPLLRLGAFVAPFQKSVSRLTNPPCPLFNGESGRQAFSFLINPSYFYRNHPID